MEEALPFITSFGRNKDSKRIQNLGKSAKAVGLGSTSRPYVVRRLRPAEASGGEGSFSEGDLKIEKKKAKSSWAKSKNTNQGTSQERC